MRKHRKMKESRRSTVIPLVFVRRLIVPVVPIRRPLTYFHRGFRISESKIPVSRKMFVIGSYLPQTNAVLKTTDLKFEWLQIGTQSVTQSLLSLSSCVVDGRSRSGRRTFLYVWCIYILTFLVLFTIIIHVSPLVSGLNLVVPTLIKTTFVTLYICLEVFH